MACDVSDDSDRLPVLAVFPFIYAGTSYNGCATEGNDVPWCATTLDTRGESAAWSDCTTCRGGSVGPSPPPSPSPSPPGPAPAGCTEPGVPGYAGAHADEGYLCQEVLGSYSCADDHTANDGVVETYGDVCPW